MDIATLRDTLTEYLARAPEAGEDPVWIVLQDSGEERVIIDLDFGYRYEDRHPALIVTVDGYARWNDNARTNDERGCQRRGVEMPAHNDDGSCVKPLTIIGYANPDGTGRGNWSEVEK